MASGFFSREKEKWFVDDAGSLGMELSQALEWLRSPFPVYAMKWLMSLFSRHSSAFSLVSCCMCSLLFSLILSAPRSPGGRE